MAKTVYQGYYDDPKNQDKQINIYAYHSPSGGRTKIQGMIFQGTDYRTVERFEEYKECGFNTVLAQTGGNWAGEPWEESNAKLVLDLSAQAGIDKVIILDEWLRLFSLQHESIVGEGNIMTQNGQKVFREKFKDEAELDAYIKERMAPYVDHPSFYGVQLIDEPGRECFKAIGDVYRSIKRVYPKVHAQVNIRSMFFRLITGGLPDYDYDDTLDFNGRYKAYVEEFLDETGADYVLTDRYPFHEGIGNDVYPYYFLSFQILNEIARERNITVHFVLQSFGSYINGSRTYRMPNEGELKLQMHLSLGFGIQELAYYTYFGGGYYEIQGEYRLKDEGIVSADGKRTAAYPVVQKLNLMANKLAPVLLNFKHVADTYAAISPLKSKPIHLQFTRRGTLKMAEKLRVNQELGFVSELYDEEKDQYLYVLQNITSSLHCPDIERQKLSLTFKGDVTKVDVFDGNEWHTEDLDADKTYHTELDSGEAVYLLPY